MGCCVMHLFIPNKDILDSLNNFYFPIFDLIIKIFVGYILILFLRRRTKSEKIQEKLTQIYLDFLELDKELQLALNNVVLSFLRLEILKKLEYPTEEDEDYESTFSDYSEKKMSLFQFQWKSFTIKNQLSLLLKQNESNLLIHAIEKYLAYFIQERNSQDRVKGYWGWLEIECNKYCQTNEKFNELRLSVENYKKKYLTFSEIEEEILSISYEIAVQFNIHEKTNPEYRTILQSLEHFKKIINKYK
jgi:hypothetical protein